MLGNALGKILRGDPRLTHEPCGKQPCKASGALLLGQQPLVVLLALAELGVLLLHLLLVGLQRAFLAVHLY
jgi:hypothetical protein